MLKLFIGMIIGNITTMMLLGGASAADQALANAQALYVDPFNRPNSTTTLVLLVVVGIFMAALTMWPSKPVMETEKVIKNLRRHCK